MSSVEIQQGRGGRNISESGGTAGSICNTIYCGDNLHIMKCLPSGSLDLIYADPPFFTNRRYGIAGDGAEVREVFADRWEEGLSSYLDWLSPRLLEMKRLLRGTGSIYIHLDWHASHYVKVLMDRIFGYGNFRNEIIWYYKTGGAGKKTFSRKHDSILFYSKTAKYKFNRLMEKSYLMYRYGFRNVDIRQDGNGYYNEVKMRDVWDIPALRGNQPEKVNFPTQKPEALLRRIIASSTDEGDTVADFFCGSGTTVCVASKMKRHWIAADISPVAVEITKKRLYGGRTVKS
jgi:site-specific DNA-methyltransferase (adenine-specific)